MRERAGLDANVRVVGRVHPYLPLANQAADVAVEALGPSAEDWNLFFAVFLVGVGLFSMASSCRLIR